MRGLRRVTLLASLFSGLALLTFTTNTAHAGFRADFVGTAPGLPGQTIFNYNLIFSGALERVDSTPPSLQGFVTIYDIVGLDTNNIVVPANFTSTFQNIGIDAFGTVPATGDNPALLNVTFRYTGATPLTTVAPLVIPGFSYQSTASLTTLGSFTGQDTNNDQTDAAFNTPIGTSGRVQVAAVPEPASIALIGLGGVILLGVARRRRAKA